MDNEDVENITYANWLLLLVSGVEKALEMYQPKTQLWLQVRVDAIFCSLFAFLEFGGTTRVCFFFFLIDHFFFIFLAGTLPSSIRYRACSAGGWRRTGQSYRSGAG